MSKLLFTVWCRFQKVPGIPANEEIYESSKKCQEITQKMQRQIKVENPTKRENTPTGASTNPKNLDLNKYLNFTKIEN